MRLGAAVLCKILLINSIEPEYEIQKQHRTHCDCLNQTLS